MVANGGLSGIMLLGQIQIHGSIILHRILKLFEEALRYCQQTLSNKIK